MNWKFSKKLILCTLFIIEKKSYYVQYSIEKKLGYVYFWKELVLCILLKRTRVTSMSTVLLKRTCVMYTVLLKRTRVMHIIEKKSFTEYSCTWSCFNRKRSFKNVLTVLKFAKCCVMILKERKNLTNGLRLRLGVWRFQEK